MPHKPAWKAIKAEAKLARKQEQAKVYQFPEKRRDLENLVPGMQAQDRVEIEDLFYERFRVAEPFTQDVTREIDRAERQFKGLFPDQNENEDPDKDDIRIFIPKTLEQVQIVHAHLDGLTTQLDPLVSFRVKPSGINPLREEFARAKLAEILVDQQFRDAKVKYDVIPRWRWNFLNHPSAFIRVLPSAEDSGPEFDFQVTDRRALLIDPSVRTGNIKNAGWVIEQSWESVQNIQYRVTRGDWYLPDGISSIDGRYAQDMNGLLQKLLGQYVQTASSQAGERDRQIEVWHCWQFAVCGQPHAYGVILGGAHGRLVRYGDIPFPCKRNPYVGRSYLRDVYRVDGMSLGRQYRGIQELYSTFLNMRISDVTEGIKRQQLVAGPLFDERTQKDYKQNKRFLHANDVFSQQLAELKIPFSAMMQDVGSGDSTQHLLKDLQFLNLEGRTIDSIGDTMRGESGASGETLGARQENLFRALGVFRPIFSQEMGLLEDMAEIVKESLQDPEFFGGMRYAYSKNLSRYTTMIPGFQSDPASGLSAREVNAAEMDVDVEVEAVSQAEALASRTIRAASWQQVTESLRHFPEWAAELGRKLKIPEMVLKVFQDSGMDIENLMYTEDEQKQRDQEQQKAAQAQQQTQLQGEQALSQMRSQEAMMVEQAKAKGKIVEAQATIPLELKAAVQEIAAQLKADMQENSQLFLQDLRKMMEEAALESRSAVEGVGHGNNINRQ